jgi:transposase
MKHHKRSGARAESVVFQLNYQILVGVDLGQWLHQACVLDANGEFLEERGFEHSLSALSIITDWLLNLAGNDAERIAVAIEKPHGAVVETLLNSGIAVFSINPKQVDRFRDRHSMSGAKDDRHDAFVLADALRTDGHRFQRLHLPPPEIVGMRELLKTRDQLVKNHVALSSQIRDLLTRCWPHLVSLAPRDKALDSFFCELLQLFFDASETADLAPKVKDLVSKFRIRRVQPEQILETFQQSPLRVAPATIEATSAHLKLLLQQLLLVRRHRRDSDQLLEKWFRQQRATDEPYTDAAIIASFPGVGAFVLASVLSFAHDPVRLRNLDAFRSLSGIAPVTQKSGKRGQKKPKILMRRARSLPLNNALHHWARVAVLQDHAFKEHYDRLRERGHTHARTLRGVMDRILTMAVAMLRDRTLYDPARPSTRKKLDSS